MPPFSSSAGAFTGVIHGLRWRTSTRGTGVGTSTFGGSTVSSSIGILYVDF